MQGETEGETELFLEEGIWTGPGCISLLFIGIDYTHDKRSMDEHVPGRRLHVLDDAPLVRRRRLRFPQNPSNNRI